MSVREPHPHDSAHLHVTGAARYLDDLPLPASTLHLAFGLADTAHGRIDAMDLAAVRAAPGVVAVLTAADLPLPADVSPSAHDEPLLAEGFVHYLGQPVFVVAATSHLAARRAARLGRITISPLPAILTVDQALAAHSHFEGGPVVWTSGDAEAAIDQSPNVIEGSIAFGGQEHFYLEGQAAAVLPGEDGAVHVLVSTQHPSEIQHKVAEALGLPQAMVRVECRRMGGGFGGKESQGNAPAVACAVAARATGRPCKMRYDRDDDFMITGKRHDGRIDYRAGFDQHGRITGVSFVQLIRCGWSLDLSLPVADRAMLHADNAYHIPALRVESHRLRTNTQSATAFRGFGGPQGMLGIERVLDHIAHVLGRDPLVVRQANYYPAMGAPALARTHYGMEVRDFILHELTARLADSADYAARRARIAEWNAGSRHLKRGLGFNPVKFGISFTLTHLNQAGALVHVYTDGSVHLNHGGTEMGQGLFRKVAQVAAAEFGLGLEAIRITATDTDKVPNTSATAASSGSDLNGMAVQAACRTLRGRLAGMMAAEAGVVPEAVVFANGRIRAGDLEVPFAEAARRAHAARISLSATGYYRTPDITWNRVTGRGAPFFYFAYGAALTEVVVDGLTGEYRIVRTDILHDAGASLNPALDIGQIEGGYVQGAGWLTTEELVWDDAGRLRTHAPSTYKIPAMSDRPGQFNVDLWQAPNPAATIYRSKAVGEPPLMLGISALMGLSQAVAAFAPGAPYPALDAPATPERVLAAIRRVRGLPS
jgi:xanthine dehydrogenase large subunit